MLGKQEARISRTHGAARHPPARPSFRPFSAACVPIHLSVCPSDHKAQASSFGAKPLSMLNLSRGVPWRLTLGPPGHSGTNTCKHLPRPRLLPTWPGLCPLSLWSPGSPLTDQPSPRHPTPHPAAGRPQPGNTCRWGALLVTTRPWTQDARSAERAVPGGGGASGQVRGSLMAEGLSHPHPLPLLSPSCLRAR